MASKNVDQKKKEEERQKFAEDLQGVGENLPEHLRGVEGSDVREVVRHEDSEREALNNPLMRDPKVQEKEERLDDEGLNLMEGEEGARKRRRD